jgi:hypothetical protein
MLSLIGLVLTVFFALDILLCVLAARAEPGATIRTVALVTFGAQILLCLVGGFVAMLRFV